MKLLLSFVTILLTLEPAVLAGPRVYGGSPVEITDVPWMAYVQYNIGFGFIEYCGGSIINEMYILTAAHCATSDFLGFPITKFAPNYEIRIGSSFRDDGGSVYKVSKVIPHPKYRSAAKGHDVALLKLKTKITYTNGTVENVNLDKGEYKAGDSASSMGWGENPENPDSKQLYIADLNIVDSASCAKAYGGSASEYEQHKVCAIGPKNADVCKGDSGGPLLLLMVGRKNQQIGVVSYGGDCPQKGDQPAPGVYAKIADNLEWINDVVSES